MQENERVPFISIHSVENKLFVEGETDKISQVL